VRSRAVLVSLLLGATLVTRFAPRAQASPEATAQGATIETLKGLSKAGRYADLEAAARDLLTRIESTEGADSVAAANVLGYLVDALWRGGKAKAAETIALAERAVRLQEAARGPETIDVAESLDNLGGVLIARGDLSAARPILERSIAIKEKVLGPRDPRIAIAWSYLGAALAAKEENAEALAAFQRALAIQEASLGPAHPHVAMSLINMAALRMRTAEHAVARALLERAIPILVASLGPEHADVAAARRNLGILLAQLGELAAARATLEEALAIQERSLGAEHVHVAISLQELGTVLTEEGRLAEARSRLDRALAIKERALGPEHPGLAFVLNQIGNVLSEQGDHVAARRFHERQLAIAEKSIGPRSTLALAALTGLGHACFAAGETSQARGFYERALSTGEEVLGPEHPDLPSILSGLASVARERGDLVSARRAWERSAAIAERALGVEHPETAQALSSLAGCLADMGEQGKARLTLERALALRERALGPDHPDLAYTLTALADVMVDLEESASALPLYERALMLREKAYGAEHPRVADALLSLARGAHLAGHDERSRALCERALALAERLPGTEHRLVAGGLHQLAVLADARRDMTGARALLERCLTLREGAHGPRHPMVATTLHALSYVLAESGDLDGARRHERRAATIRVEALGWSHPLVAEAQAALARFEWLLGDSSSALEAAVRAEETSRAHVAITCRYLSEREALRHAPARASGLDVALTLVSPGAAAPAAAISRTWDELVRSRALVLDEMAARHGATSLHDDPVARARAEALATARQRLGRLTLRGPTTDSVEDHLGLLDEARRDVERADRELGERSAEVRGQAPASVGLEAVRAALAPTDVLVAFVRYERLSRADSGEPNAVAPLSPGTVVATPSYLAFVTTGRESAPVVVPLGPAPDIDALVSAWVGDASEPGNAAVATGRVLRRATWDPLARRFGAAARVFVVPDGAIHAVTFAALPTDDGRFLVETGPTIHYLSTERDLVAPSRPRPLGQGLLVLGAPAFDDSSLFAALAPQPARSRLVTMLAAMTPFRGATADCAPFRSLRFAELPGAAREASDISILWRRRAASAGHGALATHLSAASATEAAFKVRAPGRRVLHLATHAFLVPSACATGAPGGRRPARSALEVDDASIVPAQNPLRLSGLALAGANHRDAASPGEEDGVLTAEEVSSLDLSSVQWMVLSACATGVGDIHAGEGVLGLRRACQVAGARTVVMSLWPVDDAATRDWMRELYEARLARRLDTAESVRAAQLAVLGKRRARGESDGPFAWGGFVAAGDWR
jgi:tetratricopeptide (TPR) repeat protein/CHAT domain-containing protein